MSKRSSSDSNEKLLPREDNLYQDFIAYRKHVRRRHRQMVAGWIATTCVLSAVILWLLFQSFTITEYGSFARGFATELGPAKPLIELHETVFTGSPRFLDDGTEYVPDDGIDRPSYVGKPSRSIDHEWALLHWGRFFLLTKEEAQSAWGAKYEEYWSPRQGGYVAALEVMHTLHCLDHIRKSLYPEHYPQDSPVHGSLHRDHCLDHLRQTIMCNADLTPIPSRFYLGIGDNYIDSNQKHVCRNWANIRDWVSERFNGSLAVPPAEGTKSGGTEWS